MERVEIREEEEEDSVQRSSGGKINKGGKNDLRRWKRGKGERLCIVKERRWKKRNRKINNTKIKIKIKI